MAKNVFDPFVLLLMPDPEPTTVTGGATGQSTTDPYPCSFTDWQTMFEGDYDFDGDVGTNNDYVAWWYINNFTDEQYQAINGTALPPDPRPNP